MKMNKTLVLVFAALFIGLLVSCDYLETDKLSPEKKLALAEKCSKAGKAYADDYIRANLPDGYLWDEPEYHYSRTLNTCLVHIRWVSHYIPGNPSYHCNQVIDVFANKTLLRGYFVRDAKTNGETLSDLAPNDGVPNFTSAEFFKQKNKLFSE